MRDIPLSRRITPKVTPSNIIVIYPLIVVQVELSQTNQFRNPMRYLLIILSVFIFSLLIISCGDKEEYTEEDSVSTITTTSGLYVAVGQSGKILTSSDGTSWTSRTSGTSSNLVGVTYGDNKFFTMLGTMGSSIGTVITSSNGTSWSSTSATCSSCGTDNVTINDFSYIE